VQNSYLRAERPTERMDVVRMYNYGSSEVGYGLVLVVAQSIIHCCRGASQSHTLIHWCMEHGPSHTGSGGAT